jgi:hypothetical protein
MSPIDEQAIQATDAPAEAHHLTAAVFATRVRNG